MYAMIVEHENISASEICVISLATIRALLPSECVLV